MSNIKPIGRVEDGVRMLRWRGTVFPGQVIVFLHGLGDGADVWRPVMRHWPDGPITAIAVDFPGHGGSAFWDDKEYSVPNFAVWLADVLAREGIRNPALVGHSMGARVALEASKTGLVDPAHMVVVDVSPDPREKGDEELDRVIENHLQLLAAGAPSMTSFRQKVARRLPMADPDVLDEILPALVDAGGPRDDSGGLRLDPEIRRLLKARNEVDGWSALQALDCPTTIIRGSFSSALDAETARRMLQSTRKPAGCLTIPRAGHAIPFEQPQAMAEAIAKGLRGGS